MPAPTQCYSCRGLILYPPPGPCTDIHAGAARVSGYSQGELQEDSFMMISSGILFSKI